MEVINTIRAKTDRVILFYSCGKDSIVLLDLLAPYFKEVVCVFMYFIPDLEHIEKYIRHAKLKYKNVKFIQVQHWLVSSLRREGVYCDADKSVKVLKLSDVVTTVKAQAGIEYCFLGMKQADSFNRILMLRGYENEAINETSGMVYPLSKWTNKDVENYIRLKGLITPIKYTPNKKSQGLTLDLDVFLYLREHYPADLEKILKEFPMSEAILFEYDERERKKN